MPARSGVPAPDDGLCTIDGCNRAHKARGWCSMHYQRWQKHGTTDDPTPDSCEIAGCDRDHYARGWCQMHYGRWHAHGDPTFVLQIHGDDAARFWAKVDVGVCWRWQSKTTHDGYGQFYLDGAFVYAHRWAYEQLVGPIPEGLDIDHLCRVRSCVNPDHLEPVTRGENLLRSPLMARDISDRDRDELGRLVAA